MVWDAVFQPFIEQSPVSVMFRGTLENILSPERMDRLFAKHARQQYDHRLPFSCCVEMLGMVVVQTRPSVNAAYQAQRERVAVSVQSVYQKLAGIEPQVSEALVRETAADLAAVVDAMHATTQGPLSGYDSRIVDGNHLQGTQHRLKELRRLGDAALPGSTVAVLDPQRELIEDILVCQDGHANQKPLYRQLLDKIQPRQCWIADRDFSTLEFLFGVQQRSSYFLIRQHGQLQAKPVGVRQRVGRTETGLVFEQNVLLTNYNGQTMRLRRITLQLDKPTREKDTEIHLLSNLPGAVEGPQIANAYLGRWQIEAAFFKLTMVLRCELNTLGYPEAALFGFCLAVVMYNAVSTVLTALRKTHSTSKLTGTQTKLRPPKQKFSFYYVADEIAGVWRGMAIVIAADHWTAAFAGLTPSQLARKLLWLANHVPPDKFLCNPARVKKRKARRIIQHGGHVSTHRLLQKRKYTKPRQQ
jgi:hypothetical protein